MCLRNFKVFACICMPTVFIVGGEATGSRNVGREESAWRIKIYLCTKDRFQLPDCKYSCHSLIGGLLNGDAWSLGGFGMGKSMIPSYQAICVKPRSQRWYKYCTGPLPKGAMLTFYLQDSSGSLCPWSRALRVEESVELVVWNDGSYAWLLWGPVMIFCHQLSLYGDMGWWVYMAWVCEWGCGMKTVPVNG